MSTSRVSNKRLRDVQRVVHITGALALGTFIYSPAGDVLVFERLMQIVVVPVVTITGILMWKLPQIRKAFRARSAGASSE